MHPILWIQQHPVISALTGYMLFSNAVSAMPTPDPKGSKGYAWLFAFLHGVASNLGRVQFVRAFIGKYVNSGTNDAVPSEEKK